MALTTSRSRLSRYRRPRPDTVVLSFPYDSHFEAEYAALTERINHIVYSDTTRPFTASDNEPYLPLLMFAELYIDQLTDTYEMHDYLINVIYDEIDQDRFEDVVDDLTDFLHRVRPPYGLQEVIRFMMEHTLEEIPLYSLTDLLFDDRENITLYVLTLTVVE